MKKLAEERVWIVVHNRFGAYYGTFRTRNEAKAYHAHCHYGTREFVEGGKLSPEQQEAWNKCAANGDRVVRAKLVWEQ